MVDGHVGRRHVAPDRAEIEDAATASRHHAGKKAQGQFGQRADIDIDKLHLLGPAKFGGGPSQADTGIVYDNITVKAAFL